MASLFSVGGLATGLDSNTIISQLLSIERAPENRIQAKITSLTAQQNAVKDARTSLLTLRNLLKDFQLGLKFKTFEAPSSDENILTATAPGTNPTQGNFAVQVVQLATASTARSSARLGAPINPAAALNSSGISTAITAGTFTINGVQFNVNPATDTLNSIIGQINASAAGVTATYNAGTDTISLANTTAGNTAIINLGATGDTSNALAVLGLKGALQTTGLNGSTQVGGNLILGAVSTANVLNTVSFAGGAVSAGNFRINGVTINVDPTVDTLGDVLSRINASGAGVTAALDFSTDTIRVVSKNLGSRTISFQDGTSNFLTRANLTTATQTAGQDAQYRVDGGAVQTSNSNSVTSAINGVTLNFKAVGTSNVSVNPDADAIVASVQSFVTAFNASVKTLSDQSKKGGVLEGDSTLRSIQNFLQGNVFGQVAGLPGGVQSLRDIGISTGATFDVHADYALQIDETKLRAAIAENRAGVESIFTNSSHTGVADSLFGFIDAASSTAGYLNDRARAGGSIDVQIQSGKDRIAAIERSVKLTETRLRQQFANLETLTASLQSQGASLNGIK